MSTDNTDLGRAAIAILRELVADRRRYTAKEFDQMQADFREACGHVGVEPKTVMMQAASALCDANEGFEDRLRRRAAAVDRVALH
jgi:hypothetical protein